MQQHIASDHPSLSVRHAVEKPRKGQADFRNENGSSGSRGTGIKGHHFHPSRPIGYQSLERGCREPQSGDTRVTYHSAQSQQRHPLPLGPRSEHQGPLPVTDNYIATLLSCAISNSDPLLATY